MANSNATDAQLEVSERIDIEHLTERCTGRGDSLRSSKPTTDADTGLEQYVWRMCEFHAGVDTSMPVTAAWWLQSWLDDDGIDASVSGVTDDAGTEITGYLDAVVGEVLANLGYNSSAAAERWQDIGVCEVSAE